jgi:outer membrane receptor protein involved in Fe transport
MRRTLFLILAIGIATTAGSLRAQNPGRPSPGQLPTANGEVRGSVIDENNAPVARATITVRSKRDSSLVAGAIATTEGAFNIQGLRPGAYYLRVTSIGFGPRIQEFTIADASARASLGIIKLSRVAVALSGVEVTAERATVVIEPDRNAYRAKDIAPAAANASEVLDAVPSVQVDGDGKVSLRGNENVAVQINGRPSPIRGTQLGAFLKGLPANIVERIEVIPNPSAKYDPEGMAGIINIVLKQNTDLGVSGGLNAGMAKADRYNGSGNIGYQSGPLTTFSSLGFYSDDRGIVGINDRERLDALRAPLSITEQDIEGQNANVGQNLTTNVDYKLNPRDVFSNALSINHRHSTDESVSAYTELNGSRTLLEKYDRPRDANTKSWMFDYTTAFKRTFEPRKHELSAELRFNRSDDKDRTALWKEPFTGTTTGPVTRLESETDDTDALTQQLTGQLDYTRTLTPQTKLEAGYKGNARWLDRDYLVRKDALGTGNWVRSNLSNSFQFDEQVQAAYGVLSQSAGKFDLQGGLRAEYASRNFSLASPSKSYPFNYTSLFPSGLVSYKLSDATQAKVSYSRRIRRPGSQELNPFPSFFDVQNVFIGNPNLNPEYTDAIEMGLSRTGALGSIQLSPFYRRTTDVIRVDINTADVIDGRDVTTVTFKNLATSNSWGTDLNGSLRLGPKFNGFASFNVFKMVTDGGSESSLSSDAVTWSGRLNATTQITPMTILQGSYFYRAPVNIERGRFAAMQMASFSIRQKLYGDKASLSLRAQDPFNTMKFKINVGDDNVTQLTERRFGVRAVFLTFQYNYGQAPKVRQPKQEQQPESQTGFPPP